MSTPTTKVRKKIRSISCCTLKGAIITLQLELDIALQQGAQGNVDLIIERDEYYGDIDVIVAYTRPETMEDRELSRLAERDSLRIRRKAYEMLRKEFEETA